ncbi:MAG: hypothetical protein WCA49_14435 [Candidatus Sulfotelmatobacter sp.]
MSAGEIEEIRNRVANAIAPVKEPEGGRRYAYGSARTKGGRGLPPYYLVYFLLVDLLKFGHGGRGEKVAWTIPVDYQGSAALIEHRKMGLGIFSAATAEDEIVAEGIVKAIHRGIKAAAPFFDHLAAEAVERSRLNVRNNSGWLFGRYEYLRDQFREKTAEAEARKREVEKTEEVLGNGTKVMSYSYPAFGLRREAGWIGIAAIDAFFSWTEHVLIHIAILNGKIKTGEEVADLAGADWTDKIKAAVDLDDAAMKTLYDELLVVRRQVRNYMAHGAFGKNGEAFEFHSGAGAVPVNLTDPEGRDRFSMWESPSFDELGAIETAEAFVEKLWDGDLAPAKLYLQEADLPIILTYASDGTYQGAMTSLEAMESLVEGMTHEIDRAANMD